MKIYALSIVSFMTLSKRPVVLALFCRIIENGYYVLRRLLTLPWATNCVACSSLFSSTVLL